MGFTVRGARAVEHPATDPFAGACGRIHGRPACPTSPGGPLALGVNLKPAAAYEAVAGSRPWPHKRSPVKVVAATGPAALVTAVVGEGAAPHRELDQIPSSRCRAAPAAASRRPGAALPALGGFAVRRRRRPLLRVDVGPRRDAEAARLGLLAPGRAVGAAPPDAPAWSSRSHRDEFIDARHQLVAAGDIDQRHTFNKVHFGRRPGGRLWLRRRRRPSLRVYRTRFFFFFVAVSL